MHYDLEVLRDYIDRGLVIKQDHPTLPLSIYNYSRDCQYEGKWDDITLNCRGLVLDKEGKVIAKPFPKFFNYEEHIAEGSKLPPIPNETFEVFEKMDGSLGIFFYYERELTYEERYKIWYRNNFVSGFEYNESVVPNFDDPYYEPTPTKEGGWHMATRGSFTSEQAIRAMEIAKREGLDRKAVPGFTYLFEIIYPENRIVCDYGDTERLVLLAIVNPEGEELPYEMIADDGWDIVYRYEGLGEGYELLKEKISNDEEGYVIRFSGGMRMKIKGEEYVRLHRILTNFSSKDIWELLKNGEPLEPFLERVPDEFDKWVKDTIKELRYSCYHIRETAGKLHDKFRYGMYNDVDPEPTKKEFAEYVMKQAEHLRPIMFAMWENNNQRVDEIIWKLVKPKYEKPFKNNQEQ